jgi:PHD/YefM family antitoxin component YafN of YafNO toxin-antitoxin module
MSVSSALLRAPRIGAREFRNNACFYIKSGKLYMITEHGKPAGVFMPYEEALELMEIIDELNDKELLKTIAEGRKAIKRGSKGITLTDALEKRGF